MRAAHLTIISALLACGPDQGKEPKGDEAKRYAEKVCGAIEACGCFDHYGSEELCENQLSGRFKALQDAGLNVQVGCFEQVVDDGGVDDCSPSDEAPTEWLCTVLRGETREGEPCSDHYLELPPFDASECAEGLSCVDGVCAPEGTPGQVRAVGDACIWEQSGSCNDFTLYCDSNNVCQPTIEVGGACDSFFACLGNLDENNVGAYCEGVADDGIGACARKSVVGEACDPEDWHPCAEAALEPTVAWCDPAQDVCIADGPAVCLLTDFPKARPVMP